MLDARSLLSCLTPANHTHYFTKCQCLPDAVAKMTSNRSKAKTPAITQCLQARGEPEQDLDGRLDVATSRERSRITPATMQEGKELWVTRASATIASQRNHCESSRARGTATNHCSSVTRHNSTEECNILRVIICVHCECNHCKS